MNALPALAPQARARPRGRRRAALLVSAPVVGARRARGPARVARPPDLPPAPRRQGRARVRGLQAAHDGLRRRAHRRRAWRSTRATRGSRASARSCAAPRSTSCRTWSTCCAARCRSSARARRSRSRSTQYTERQRRRLDVAPGPDRLGAGQRPRVAAVARAHRARPLVPRARVAAARPAHPRPHRADGRHRSRPLPRRDRRLALSAATGRLRGPCRCTPCGRRGSRRRPCRFIVGQPSWWSHAVAATANGILVVVLEQQHVVAVVDLLDERLELRDGRRRACPACTGCRCARARACARACRAPACRPAS